MKWFNKLPPELRHLITNALTLLIMAQAVKHGVITQDQAAQSLPSVGISTTIN